MIGFDDVIKNCRIWFHVFPYCSKMSRSYSGEGREIEKMSLLLCVT